MKKCLGLALAISMLVGVSAFAEEGVEAQLNPATDAYEESYVTIEAEDHEIPAIVGLPKGEVKGAVVMLHGTGSTKNEAGDGYKVACPILGEEYGLATIRLDFMGNGDSTADYENYNFTTAVADAMAARDYLATLVPEGTKFGVMGWSQGGTDALLAAGENPDAFGSIVTWAGAPDLSDMLTDEYYEEAKENGFFVVEFDWRDPLHVGLQWCEDVKSVDVLSVFSAFEGPVLAIAGEEDTSVDPEWSNKIVETSQNPASKTYFIPGMDHTFNVFAGEDYKSLKDAAAATGAFFAETLGE
ncbi:MAG: alpha/beta fold hydrolase [Blautia sp.]|nr:alpha/beta fold hydrolase [Blautia sp.]